MFPQEGEFARGLDAALARRGGASVAFAVHERALLAPAGDRASYIEQALPRKKLKELGRQMRRLGDDGAVAWDIARDPAAIGAALADFLALEEAGWKGRAGTAAARSPSLRAFLEASVSALAREGKTEILRLMLAGRAIAALIVLRSGDTAWCWKIAYDETFARFSPGAQLMLEAGRALLADGPATRIDSCAVADHPMVDHVWKDRVAIGTMIIGPPGGGIIHNAGVAAAKAELSARGLVRRLKQRL